MSLLTASSMKSRQRGYEYFKSNKVSNLQHPEEMRFRADVSGSEKEPYTVTIDLDHVRQSSCNCPHAAGRRIICKHMIAVFFTAFPEEAEKYYTDVLKEQEEWENHQEELNDQLIKYVYGLKKREAQELLLEVLECGPEWQWERFIEEHIESQVY